MAKITYITKDESNYRLYGAPTGYFDDLYEERQRRFMAGASTASRDFFNRTASIRDKWHGSAAIEAGRLAVAKIANNLSPSNTVRALVTKEDFQTARGIMRDLVVAHPSVRKLVTRGAWSGYGIDMESKGTELYSHARDGVILIDEETDELTYTRVLYVEGFDEDQRFTDGEIMDIHTTYEELESAVEGTEDFTSQWG